MSLSVHAQAASFGPGTAFSLLRNPHRRTTTLPVAKNAAALPRTKSYHLWMDTRGNKRHLLARGLRSSGFAAGYAGQAASWARSAAFQAERRNRSAIQRYYWMPPHRDAGQAPQARHDGE